MWPELVSGERFVLRSFAVVFVAALGLFRILLRRGLRRREIDPALADRVILWGLPLFLLGSRLSWQLFERGRWTLLEGGGLDYWGGLGLAGVGLLILAALCRWPLGATADALALAGLASAALIRLGSLLDGGYTGLPISEDAWFAIRFPSMWSPGSFLGVEVPANDTNLASGARGRPLHPAALYAAGAFFAVFVALRARRPRRGRGGETAALALLGGGSVSFAVAFFRGDLARPFFGALSRVHLEALAAALLGGIAYGAIRRFSGLRSSSGPGPFRPREERADPPLLP
jgi:prolipoprotein diacylglyceryltransferase